MKNTRTSVVAALLAALAFGPALAEKGGGGHGKHGRGHDDVRVVERDDHRGRRHGDDHRLDDRRHRGEDRVVIVDRHHQRDRACPPGLARKGNGCLPPGQAKRVIVGQALPPGAVFVVPQRVRATLPPPPLGHRYAVVNNQVVLVSDTNNVVVNIIRSLLG
jgi:Ni/Co efflux regulator RcnB